MLEDRNSEGSVLRFGVFTVDLATGNVWKRDSKAKLQEQPFRILALLLECPGELVTRQTIRKVLWPEDTFVEYDQSINAAVAKLRAALEDSADHPRFVETVAKQGYRFIASVNGAADLNASARARTEPPQLGGFQDHWQSVRRFRSAFQMSLLLLLVVAGTAVTWWIWQSRTKAEPSSAALPLTSSPGYQLFPTFSPEGTRVAFCGYEPGKRSAAIYVKLIGPGDPVRISESQDGDLAPAWSPDGGTIAFLRVGNPLETAILLVPALGGPTKQVATIRFDARMLLEEGALNSTTAGGPLLAWSRDGKWLLAPDCGPQLESCAIIRVAVDSGGRQRLTSPVAGRSDATLSISPNGETLAFTRSTALPNRDIYTVRLSADLEAISEPKQLTFDSKSIEGLAWTPDGRRLVFSSRRGGSLELWQMNATPGSKPVRIEGAGEEPTGVALSREAHHLVYSHFYRDSNIWRMAISGPETGESVNILSSTRRESEPKYSPDGSSIAFESDRTGNEEIWTAKQDGSDPVQITYLDAWAGSPRWSPDGTKLAFDCNVAGDWNIYVINSQGGRPVRLNMSGANGMRPSWSHDGKWIYYSSWHHGRNEIYKIPSAGGPEVQLTTEGGFLAFESADGQDLYYSTVTGGLAKTPVQGGETSTILKSIHWLNFAPGKHGIYFIEGSSEAATLKLLNPATQSIRSIATVSTPAGLGGEIAISPDEHWLLYEKTDRAGSELMIIKNFR